MKKVIFALSKFWEGKHEVAKLLEVIVFRDVAKISPTISQYRRRSGVLRSPLGRFGAGGPEEEIKPGCKCGPFCRRWQNE